MKINLIPEVKKEQLRVRSINLWTTNVAVALGILLGSVILVLLVYMGGITAKIKVTENDTVSLQEKLKAYDALEKTVLSIEEGVKEVKQILNNEDKWQTVFSLFEGATPEDIRFRSLSISPELNVNAEVEGKDINSIDRFIKSIENYKYQDKSAFSKADVGGYSTNEKGLVSFSATFSINKDALVKVQE